MVPQEKKLDTSKINYSGWEAKTNIDQGINLILMHFEKEINENTLRM